MRSYWVKIGAGAILIFVVGFAAMSGIKKVKSQIESSEDFEIPLGAFIPFKFDGTKVGTLRSITIRRGAPNVLSGFDMRLRTADTAVFAKLESCHLSVSDARNIDERTTFICLQSDSGTVAFGEVSINLRTESDDRTLVRPLMLPQEVVAGMQRGRGDQAGRELADSIAADVRGRIRPLRQQYNDSVEAARLDARSAAIKQQAESLRARSKAGAAAPPATAVPPKPPSP